jgi:hypothetical protein
MRNSLVRFDLYNDLKALLAGFKKSIFLRCYASHEQQREEHYFQEMLYIAAFMSVLFHIVIIVIQYNKPAQYLKDDEKNFHRFGSLYGNNTIHY